MSIAWKRAHSILCISLSASVANVSSPTPIPSQGTSYDFNLLETRKFLENENYGRHLRAVIISLERGSLLTLLPFLPQVATTASLAQPNKTMATSLFFLEKHVGSTPAAEEQVCIVERVKKRNPVTALTGLPGDRRAGGCW